ncbi:MAG: type III polyketide synthase [Elusimicrobia bacterium]|nr:type III polyketide synthase [Elusimicrobiota bacterium]
MHTSSLASETRTLLEATPVEVLSVGTAVPPLRLTQKESLDYILTHFPIRAGTKALYKRVFQNESVETRHFALKTPDEVLEASHDQISARFEKWAVALSTDSLQAALKEAGLSPRDVDFLAVATCTGYLCPGLSAYVVESAGLRHDVRSADIVGMGCGAALPALEQAFNHVAANPGATAAVICTEICSAAMFSDDAPDLVISNALFADGSAAAILRSAPSVPGNGREGRLSLTLQRFSSLVYPEWRETLRFRTVGGRLRNVLGRDVPLQAAQAVEALRDLMLRKHDLAPEEVRHWILHPGGEKIMRAVQDALHISPVDLAASRNVLRQYGNMSSPTVLFVLKDHLGRLQDRGMEHLRDAKPRWGVMASFGAGFSVHGALFQLHP